MQIRKPSTWLEVSQLQVKHATLTWSWSARTSGQGYLLQKLFVTGHNLLLSHFHIMRELLSVFYSAGLEHEDSQHWFFFSRLLKVWDELSKWQTSLFLGTKVVHLPKQENGWKFSHFFPSYMVAIPSDSNDSNIFYVCWTMMILWWKCWHFPAPGKFLLPRSY